MTPTGGLPALAHGEGGLLHHESTSLDVILKSKKGQRIFGYCAWLGFDFAFFKQTHSLLIRLPVGHKFTHSQSLKQRIKYSTWEVKIYVKERSDSILDLTTREKDIRKWIIEEKSSWRVDKISRIFDRTVKFH